MNFRTIFSFDRIPHVSFFPCFCFFMTYSILLWRFWDTFFFSFSPHLLFSPLTDVFLRSLTFLIFFTTFQLIISTKNPGVLCYFRFWFFNSDHLFAVNPILFLNLSLSFPISFIFFNRLYTSFIFSFILLQTN